MSTDDTAPDGAGGPVWSLREAVEHTGASRSTLQRRLKEGAVPGAERDEAGGWRIPLAGLIAAGILPKQTPADTGPPAPDPAVEVVELRAELAVERERRQAAEALAEAHRERAEAHRERAEAHRERADDLRAAVEALSRALPPAPSADTLTAPRRRWWGR